MFYTDYDNINYQNDYNDYDGIFIDEDLIIPEQYAQPNAPNISNYSEKLSNNIIKNIHFPMNTFHPSTTVSANIPVELYKKKNYYNPNQNNFNLNQKNFNLNQKKFDSNQNKKKDNFDSNHYAGVVTSNRKNNANIFYATGWDERPEDFNGMNIPNKNNGPFEGNNIQWLGANRQLNNINNYDNYDNYGNYGNYGNYDNYDNYGQNNSFLFLKIFLFIILIILICILGISISRKHNKKNINHQTSYI